MYLAHHARTNTTLTADTLVELVTQFCTFGEDAHGLCSYQLLHCRPAPFHGYTADWTPDEISRDRAATIARRCIPGQPWVVYRPACSRPGPRL